MRAIRKWASTRQRRRGLTLCFGLMLGSGTLLQSAEALAGVQIDDELLAALERPVYPRADVLCPPPELYSSDRPGNGPIVVGIGVWLQDVAHLDDIEQTLELDAYVIQRWLDERLADPSRGDAAADCPIPEGLWVPATEPENLRSRESLFDDRMLVDAQGMITYVRRALIETAYPLDFRDFPLDRHRWRFTVWPTYSRVDEMIFQSILVGRNDDLTIQGWYVGQPEAELSVVERPPKSGEFARYDVYLDLERDWRHYLWRLGLPLTLIVLMAYGVYFIPPGQIGEQTKLGTTAILTLIAYMIALGSSLPRISYLTRADVFFVTSALLVFLGLVKALYFMLVGSDARSVFWIDRVGRVSYPIMIVLAFYVAFLR